MGFWFRLAVWWHVFWGYVSRQDVVYAKINGGNIIWDKFVKTRWDPFETNTNPYVIINGKERDLRDDGTISPAATMQDILMSARYNGKTASVESLDRWMFVSKSKRVLRALQRS